MYNISEGCRKQDTPNDVEDISSCIHSMIDPAQYNMEVSSSASHHISPSRNPTPSPRPHMITIIGTQPHKLLIRLTARPIIDNPRIMYTSYNHVSEFGCELKIRVFCSEKRTSTYMSKTSALNYCGRRLHLFGNFKTYFVF